MNRFSEMSDEQVCNFMFSRSRVASNSENVEMSKRAARDVEEASAELDRRRVERLAEWVASL